MLFLPLSPFSFHGQGSHRNELDRMVPAVPVEGTLEAVVLADTVGPEREIPPGQFYIYSFHVLDYLDVQVYLVVLADRPDIPEWEILSYQPSALLLSPDLVE